MDSLGRKAALIRSLPVEIECVSKRYAGVAALDNVSLQVKAGEFLSLLGPSGSGKTTLLMVFAGFIRPDAGRILFGDRDVSLTPPHKRNVGVVFQNYALFPHMTVLANVIYPLRIRGVRTAEARERARHALDIVKLAGLDGRKIDQLSGGQQQRVALARAIVFDPPILLMDEPLSALDKKLRDAMQIELRRIHERVGATSIYVTHDQREALALSDRVAVLNNGRLEQLDDPDRLYRNPASLFVADFLGDSHFLPAQRTGGEVICDGRPLMLTSAPPQGERLVMVLRPEKLELLLPNAPATCNIFEGILVRRVFLGDCVLLTVLLQSGIDVSVKVPTRHEFLRSIPDDGAVVRLGLAAQDTILLAAEDSDAKP